MPHLTIEYSANLSDLPIKPLLNALNQAMLASGEFEPLDVKSRAVQQDQFLVGLMQEGHAYLHVKVALLSGRSAETKANISSQLLLVLQQQISPIKGIRLQLCVEMLEIDRASYSKAVL